MDPLLTQVHRALAFEAPPLAHVDFNFHSVPTEDFNEVYEVFKALAQNKGRTKDDGRYFSLYQGGDDASRVRVTLYEVGQKQEPSTW